MMPALTSQETKQLLAFQTNEITDNDCGNVPKICKRSQ